jgi:hypothetical protein
MDQQGSMDIQRATLCHRPSVRRGQHQVILQSVHSHWNWRNGDSECAENAVYDPLSRSCLPGGTTDTAYASFAIPLAFDVVIVLLTAFKTYRLAAALRKQSGAMIVRTIPYYRYSMHV